MANAGRSNRDSVIPVRALTRFVPPTAPKSATEPFCLRGKIEPLKRLTNLPAATQPSFETLTTPAADEAVT